MKPLNLDALPEEIRRELWAMIVPYLTRELSYKKQEFSNLRLVEFGDPPAVRLRKEIKSIEKALEGLRE
jgi:hypothetical protein